MLLMMMMMNMREKHMHYRNSHPSKQSEELSSAQLGKEGDEGVERKKAGKYVKMR